MIFKVTFRGPYDSDGIKRVAWVYGTNNGEQAAKTFRRFYPNAESVSTKSMLGEVVLDASKES